MDLISVIVPIYRVENDLEKCILSIQAQTYSNLEIILVDDGSPDKCGAICDKFAAMDSRIVVIHKTNGGLSDARNAGIEIAKGKYLAFVDSDDWIDPMMMEVLHRVCVDHHAQIAECSFRNVFAKTIKEETKCTGKILKATPIEAIESNLKWQSFKTVVWNKLYHREVIGSIRFPKGKVHEDEFTTHKFYLAADGIVYVDVSFYNYNKKRDGSITGSFRIANLDAAEAFHEKANLIEERNDLKRLRKPMCNNYCYIFFDKLSQCVDAGLQGERLDSVIEFFAKDMQWMTHNDLEPHYITLFDELVQQGAEACAHHWNQLVGRE